MMNPLLLELSDDSVPDTVACRVFGSPLKRSIRGAEKLVSQRDWDDVNLINAGREIHAHGPTFGQ
jgi:hypothetical protein